MRSLDRPLIIGAGATHGTLHRPSPETLVVDPADRLPTIMIEFCNCVTSADVCTKALVDLSQDVNACERSDRCLSHHDESPMNSGVVAADSGQEQQWTGNA